MDEKKAPELIRISFTYEREEYAGGIRFYLRRSHVISWVQVLVLAMALAAMAGVMLLQWPGSFTVLNTFVLVLLGLVSLCGVYLYAVKPGRVFDRTPRLSQPVSFTFSREDIARQDRETAVLLEWSVKKFWRSPRFYYLIEGRDAYLMLPRRAFGSPEERKAFERMVMDANPGLTVKDYG